MTDDDVVGVAAAGVDVLGPAATGADVLADAEGAGTEVAGDMVGCPDRVPEECPELPAIATPGKAHPASSPTDIDATATGRHARRRGRRTGCPGPASPAGAAAAPAG